MTPQSLEQSIQNAGGNAATMLRQLPGGPYRFPIPQEEYTNWRDEQESWRRTAVLFDQSFHMSDVYFTGPDVKRLFSDTGVNSFANFGKDKAKQFVAVNPQGKVIADAILFAFADDEYSLVGGPAAANWVQYQSEIGDYDVTVTRDEASMWNPGERLLFRLQLQGPRALDIAAAAAGTALPKIKFFNIGEFDIAGTTVRALNHTMIGTPGHEMTGLEMTGPWRDHDKVYDALVEAGEQFGMRIGGARSYPTTSNESGWIALPLPAVYTGTDMKAYREWLPALGFEGQASLGGSFHSDDVEDYYVTPYDLGYGKTVKFDHDFIGREALEQVAQGPQRRKVWLEWNDDDVARVVASSLFGGVERAKFLSVPSAWFSIIHYDKVLSGDDTVGFGMDPVYTVNHKHFVSLGVIDESKAIDGSELTLVWGDEASIGHKLQVEAHKETTVRVRVRTTQPGVTR
ncbi:aminomethyltransferase family protein [Pseudonocardia sp. MH-G8]|uniref:aminomethyltransferase family protein n=1 Tax=Pseudonocardia sp. MH-G8 TaxID=1854588 RepID=UPI0018E9520E|nr:aminomethyltransferase family protein [Pseudonocardia sp. MH-G8]